MPEEILFEDERRKTRGEVASYLRSVADTLDAGDAITFGVGEQTVTVETPERPTVEVKVEPETARGVAGELSIELEQSWRKGEAADAGDLSIG